MFRKLLAPLDGSELAERALPYAIRLAQAGRGRLILTRVALAPPPRTLDGSDWERGQLEALEEAQTYLRGAAEAPLQHGPARIHLAFCSRNDAGHMRRQLTVLRQLIETVFANTRAAAHKSGRAHSRLITTRRRRYPRRSGIAPAAS